MEWKCYSFVCYSCWHFYFKLYFDIMQKRSKGKVHIYWSGIAYLFSGTTNNIFEVISFSLFGIFLPVYLQFPSYLGHILAIVQRFVKYIWWVLLHLQATWNIAVAIHFFTANMTFGSIFIFQHMVQHMQKYIYIFACICMEVYIHRKICCCSAHRPVYTPVPKSSTSHNACINMK